MGNGSMFEHKYLCQVAVEGGRQRHTRTDIILQSSNPHHMYKKLVYHTISARTIIFNLKKPAEKPSQLYPGTQLYTGTQMYTS